MQTGAASFSTRAVLDRLEQVTVLALYVLLTARLWPSNFSLSNAFPLLLLASEGVVVLLLLIRRPTEMISVRPSDWALAAGGTFLSLLVGKGGEPVALSLGVTVMIIGMTVHIGAKLSLFKSFGLVAANRGVKIGGLYRFIRHPMYAGYIVSHIGYLLLAPSWRNFVVYLGVWGFLVARIFAEERVLLSDPDYRVFAETVRSRLIPGVF